MIFGGASLRLLYRTGVAVGAARLARRGWRARLGGAVGGRGWRAFTGVGQAREYPTRNSRNICAEDFGLVEYLGSYGCPDPP